VAFANAHVLGVVQAAEALGSIAADECEELLQKYQSDPNTDLIVKQSCDVALDIMDYWSTSQ